MRRNTELRPKSEPGEALILDVSHYLSRIGTLLKSAGVDPFLVVQNARIAVVEFATSCKDINQESTFSIAKRMSSSRKDLVEWLIIGSELDETIRECLVEGLPYGKIVSSFEMVFDHPHLLIRYTEPSRNHEIGFEEYVERCRREGETIHPEVDKQLRYFRSVRASQVHVPHRRRFRTTPF